VAVASYHHGDRSDSDSGRFIEFVLGVASRVEIFVILCLWHSVFKMEHSSCQWISVHTTYLTGMITSLISTEAEKYASEVIPRL